jgi:D-alanine-D-alanine ligase
MALIRVGVLRGGVSNEYEMSLRVGQHILNMLAKAPLDKKYKGVDVLIDRTGEWHIDGIPHTPESALRQVDVVFSTLRGEFGEDGKLQQMLDLFAKPYVGSKALSTAMTQNKVLAKNHFKQQGIKTPYFKEFHLEHGTDLDPLAHDLFRSFPMPVIVKPKGQGSSLGVSFASNVKELIEALKYAQGYSNEIVVEEYLTGKEIISGFIEDFRGSDLYHMFPVEIEPHGNNFSANASEKISDTSNCSARFQFCE